MDFIDEMTKTAEIKRAIGMPKQFTKSIQIIDIALPLFKGLLIDGKTLIFEDENDIKFENKPLGAKTIVSVPYYSKQKIIGGLVIISKDQRKPTELEISILEAIGRDAGTAIAKFIAEDAILVEQRNLQSIFDTLDEFIFVIDTNSGMILNANQITIERLGYSLKKLKEMTIFQLHSKHQTDKNDQMLASLKSGKLKKFEMPITTKEGEQLKGAVTVHEGKYGGREVLIVLARVIED